MSSGATPPVVNGVTYTTNSASCSQDTSFVSVTINTINPGSVAGDQTVCSGGDPVAFTSVAPATEPQFLISGKVIQDVAMSLQTSQVPVLHYHQVYMTHLLYQ
ncbi:MAG: hypothetical protein IPO23_01190 [Flavobacterium sp.]|nr:hypothetical protein [Flavobacterium sp.]